MDSGELAISAAAAGAIVAAAVCAALAPLAVAIGRRWKILDAPGGRKHHRDHIPRTGGIAVAGGFVVGCGVALALGAFSPAADLPFGALPFVAATAIVFATGLVDDARGCPVGIKLLMQSAASLVLVASGHAVDVVSTPLGVVELGPVAGSVATVVWLVGITNAINLLDGLDGLAGGVAAIIAGSLAVFALLVGDFASIAVALALCGACLGFLPWNWRPARVFLGDSGSQTVGFVLAWLSLTASLKATTAVAVLVPILAVGVPAIDTLIVMYSRFVESQSRPFLYRVYRIVQADRLHLHHHVLTVTGYRNAVLVVYGAVLLGCLLALVTAVRNEPDLAAFTVLVEIGAVMILRHLSPRASRLKQP